MPRIIKKAQEHHGKNEGGTVMMKTADSGNPFIFLRGGMQQFKRACEVEENGGGVGKREERRAEEGSRASSALVEGGGTSLLVRESSEDAQLNWEFAVRAQPPSAAPSAEAPSTPSTRSLLRSLSELQP